MTDEDPHPDLTWPKGFATRPADRGALAVLLASSINPRRLLELAQAHRTASRCLVAVRASARRRRAPSDPPAVLRIDPDAVLERVEAAGARLVAAGDFEYPSGLLDLTDPPAGLFVKGTLRIDHDRTVAVVGARRCSAAGREMAESIGRGLGASGVCVVSGAARGIDSAAHRGALEGGGRTVAVLGCGIDVAYPPENRGLLDEIAASGAVVSEYGPGAPADPFRFPARNRIVATIGRAVVVVEGGGGSGSKITADLGLERGREVFAVPGSPTNPLAATPLELLRDGAHAIRSPADLLEDLKIRVVVPTSVRGTPNGPAMLITEPVERAVLDALAGLTTPDEVAARAGIGLPPALAILVSLELRGLVRSVGGRFERTSAVP
jgi:DNA processing protein